MIVPMKYLRLCLLATLLASTALGSIADKVVREKIAGLDVLAYRTGVEEVVTLRGSLPAGDIFAAKGQSAVPTLVGQMLDQGTTTQDKYAIAQKLDAIGAKIGFAVDGVMVEFRAKCLRKDLPLVLSILAEELRAPAFSAEEFAKVKKQISGDLQRAMESPDYRANQAFAESVYPPGHPNYSPPIKEFLAAVQSATIEELKQFHAQHYGPAEATLVAVGDIDIELLKREVAKSFDGWSGGQAAPAFPEAGPPNESKEETIAMADKPNVAVIIGQASGMKYTEPDALALRVATTVLGKGFTGRLMATVRDKEGLTYGIGASLSNDSYASGNWHIQANFAPQLLEKGMAATRRELENWYTKGITAAELERTKTNLIGSFKVGLATTDSISSALLQAVQRGLDPSWLDEYPQRINAMTLETVNAAIKKHLAPAKMTTIKAGSVPTGGNGG